MNNLVFILFSLFIFLFPFFGKHRYSRQTLSNAVISLGLLGTFTGTTYGLFHFNAEDITTSIPTLLNGIKMAVFTIITAVFSSLLLKLFPAFYGIHSEEPENTSSVFGQILSQLTALNEQLRHAGSPDKSHAEQEVLQKQSPGLTTCQEISHSLLKQLQELAETIQMTNKNLQSFLKQSPVPATTLTRQVGQLSELVKNTEMHMQQRIDEMELKRQIEIQELEKFTQTLADIIKKLNQDHDVFCKKAE